jgi:hypothetical protein
MAVHHACGRLRPRGRSRHLNHVHSLCLCVSAVYLPSPFDIALGSVDFRQEFVKIRAIRVKLFGFKSVSIRMV